MSADPIGDLLTAIRNANHKAHERVDVPTSKIKKEIARILKEEGYITDYKILPDRKQGTLRITMKYMADKTKAMRGVKRLSRPGLRVYRGCDDVPQVMGGLGITIVSTPKGLMTDRQTRDQKLGGEILAQVW